MEEEIEKLLNRAYKAGYATANYNADRRYAGLSISPSNRDDRKRVVKKLLKEVMGEIEKYGSEMLHEFPPVYHSGPPVSSTELGYIANIGKSVEIQLNDPKWVKTNEQT